MEKKSNIAYFPKPEVLIIGEEPVIPRPDTHWSKRDLVKTNCRLASSLKEISAVFPEKIEYRLDGKSSAEQLQDYLSSMEVKGYGEGSVVARRYSRPLRWKYPSQWGVITLVCRYIGSHQPFAPYLVTWFDKQEPTERAYAEDLLVIHPCLDNDY